MVSRLVRRHDYWI